MSQNSLQILFLVLAVVGLVFGFGVVLVGRRREQKPQSVTAPPAIEPPVVEPPVVEPPVVEPPVVEPPVVEPPAVVETRSVRDQLAKARANFSGAMSSVLSRGQTCRPRDAVGAARQLPA